MRSIRPRTRSRRRPWARRPLIALIALVLLLTVGYVVKASSHHHRIGTVTLSSLPTQAAQTVRLIEAGGPFPYPVDDGSVFHDDQHLLPGEPDGYYHEYTVPTPGSPDRGERRIVTGRGGQYWWTPDHYATFDRIRF